MTDLDPRIQFLIDNEHRKLGWMEEGPEKEKAKHMAKVFVMSLPWDEAIDWYNEIKWSMDHGRVRVIQKVVTVDGDKHATQYVLEQNVDGQWTEVPVIEVAETDPEIIERVKKLKDPWWKP